MKKRNLLSGLFLAAILSLGIGGIHQSAHAQSGGEWTCDNGANPVPNNYDGSVLIQYLGTFDTFDCVLGNKHVTGSIGVEGYNSVTYGSITADSGSVVLRYTIASGGDITAGTSVEADVTTIGNVTAGTTGTGSVTISHSDSFSVGSITHTGGDVQLNSLNGSIHVASINNTYGGILVRAIGLIEAPAITNKDGDVRIWGNFHQTSGDPLVIGSGGIGFIHNNGDTGWGIYISSPTGISYNGTDLLQTHADSGAPGYVYLDGGTDGTVTLAGSINVDKSDGAGSIAVFAPQIITNGITLNASAAATQPVGSINLITDQITNSGGLTIVNNGDGASQAEIHLGITPVGSWSVYPDQTYLPYPLVTGPFQSVAEPLSISGSGTLTITSNGDNHAIQIYGYPLTFGSSTVNITQQGTGDAIYVNSTDYVNNIDGVLTLGGNIEIHENTNATGATNVLDIRGTELAALTGHVLLDTSGITGGDGGDITLPFATGSLAIGETGNTIEIKADGSSTGGKGGMITAGFGGDLVITIDGGVSASAMGGDGDGGTIDITGNQITLGGELDANGQGAGSGGNITLSVTGDTPLDLTGAQQILAKGGSTGNGGTVVLPNVGNFAVDSVINVNPDDLPSSPAFARGSHSQQQKLSPLAVGFSVDSAPAGRKELNGVMCQQYLITGGSNAWPTRFWNCANPGAINSTDEIPATWIATSNKLSPTLLALIFPTDPTGGNDSPTKLYVFSTPAAFNSFFKPPAAEQASSGAAGITRQHKDDKGNWAVDIAIFEQPGLPQNQMLEATAHELGHALDDWTNPGGAGHWASTIGPYVDQDFDRLNRDLGAGTGPDQGGGTAACSTMNKAPFDGQTGATGSVINSATDAAICDEVHGTLSSGTGTNNRTIAENAAPGILDPSKDVNSEIFAEVFSWSVFTSTLSNPQYSSYYQKTFDGLLSNGYFGCALAYGQSAATGTFSLPSYCH
jgi:hypothetical protein